MMSGKSVHVVIWPAWYGGSNDVFRRHRAGTEAAAGRPGGPAQQGEGGAEQSLPIVAKEEEEEEEERVKCWQV